MKIDENEELLAWKEELESRKDEILKRREIIETKLNKYRIRLNMASTIKEQNKGIIMDKLKETTNHYRRELEEFTLANEDELQEIESIIEKIDRKLL
ncbi:hypothetical protein QA612_04235 [Evansella sp. AB-P1]|uniref:hypothetical protein n=1 Tax=Evansella sp. AB-P1 TaxID=3037653 RepID=UPI00241E3FE4|nr:hypothetical protein [Evansella sp. AB-P1]MDG5786689.1 hypothetical protein [Evansella sp. AB-P1]